MKRIYPGKETAISFSPVLWGGEGENCDESEKGGGNGKDALAS